ncbi:MAG: polynucleotide adenylyltransferase PcnB [Burkholderiaceae bacterium]|nr:polynucleotide adenylyltransferase PcnB [Burkholderiaceae bacterium]
MIKKLFKSIARLAPSRLSIKATRRVKGVPHEPELFKGARLGIDHKLISHAAMRTVQELQKAGFKAYVVGGAVRDLLLGIRPKDFDVATNAEPEQVQRTFRRARIIGRRFRLVHVMFGPETIEVSTFRALQSDDIELDEHGRVLRDNVFGEQHEDATRRDFTVNALYYDPISDQVLDYHHGVKDLKSKLLRMIGNPEHRYREDPVRMLRAVRLAAKLGFEIEGATRRPIKAMADLIHNVPNARLFDEMLKLLHSGNAYEGLRQLRAEGLHHGCLPLLDLVFDHEDPRAVDFVTRALKSTDTRIHEGKPVSPGFLFAALLWSLVDEKWRQRHTQGEHLIPALNAAIDEIIDTQLDALAIQRRYVSDMREIWLMQPRFEKRQAAAVARLMEHVRFKAAYDFLLLRAQSGQCDTALAEWWEAYLQADHAARTELISQANASRTKSGGTKRRRRRKPAAPMPEA